MYTIALFTMESFTFKSWPNDNLTVLYEIVDTEFNLIYEQLRGPLQYLCNKLLPYIEREKL